MLENAKHFIVSGPELEREEGFCEGHWGIKNRQRWVWSEMFIINMVLTYI